MLKEHFRKLYYTQSLFWDKHPAFFLGCNLLFGAWFALSFHHSLLIPLFIFSLLNIKRLLQMIVLCSAMWGYSHFMTPELPTGKGENGYAHIQMKEIQSTCNHFKRYKRYVVNIDLFKSETVQVRGVRGYMYYSGKVPSGKSYWVKGRIRSFDGRSPLLFAKKLVVDNAKTSFAYKRHKTKGKLRHYLKAKMGTGISTDLIYGLLSGEVDNMLLKLLFSQLGLSHLLAISGFHFSILIGGVGLLFARYRSNAAALIFLILLSTAYFVFVGGFVSIKRAYLMLFILFCGRIIHSRSYPINTLGCAIVMLLLYEPRLCLNLGFQLSFLATLSIILFYKKWRLFFEWLLPLRTREEALQLPPIALTAYIINSLVRRTLIVSAAVYTLCLPFCLFRFENAPILGFYYNLFMPLVVGLIMIWALSCLILPFLFPPLKWFIDAILQALFAFPANLNIELHWIEANPYLFALLFMILFTGGIATEIEHRQDRLDFNAVPVAK